MHPDSPKSKINSPSPRNDSRFRLSPSRARSSGFEDDMDPMSDLDDEQEDQIRKSREQLFVLMREAFGSPLARALQSRKYHERLKALKDVHQEMQQVEPPSDRAIPMLNACSALIKVTIQDVPNMFRAGLALLKFILTEFISRQKISRSESNNFLDRLFPVLLAKTEDPIQSLRNSAKNFILDMSEFKDVKPLHVVPRHCVVPLKSSESARLALSRMELSASLYKIHGLNSGFTLENVMTFASGALEHTSGDVRKAAESLIIAIYRDVGKPVRDHLPPDGKKIRRSIRYRQLFEALDGIDGKPHSSSYAADVPKIPYSTMLPVKRPKSSKKLLDPSVPQESDIFISRPANSSLSHSKPILTKRPINSSTYRNVNRPKTSTTYVPLALKTASSKPSRPQLNSRTNPSPPRPSYKMDQLTSGSNSKATLKGIHSIKPVEDKFCIFCGKSNQSFSEEGLNLHYWKNCPMLTLCRNCGQVVEVSGLVTHQTKHCKGKSKLSFCPRCSEAIPFEKFHAHLDTAKCLPAEESRHRCPLCHRNFIQNSGAWKRHLMGNCKENIRFHSSAA